MASLRGCFIVALLGLAGCIGGPEPLPPDMALQQASQAISAILKDEVQTTPSQLEPSEATDAPRQISFWYYEHPLLSRAFGPLQGKDAFSRAHPGVTLHAQFIGDWDVAVQKLTVAMAAGELPDVALVKRGMLARLIPSGRILPLDTFLPPSLLADFRETSRAAFTVDGQLYALPADGFCSVLLFNSSLISKAPANRRELQETARQLAPTLGVNQFAAGYLPFLPELWSAGGHIFDGDTTLATQVPASMTCRLDDAAARKTLDFLMTLKTGGLTHPRLLSDEATALRVFQSGDVAMTVASSAALAQFEGLAFPVGMAPIPGENGPVSFLSDDAVVVFRRYADARHEALVEFLDFLTGPELQGATAAARGSVPVRTSVTAQVPEGLAAAYGVAKGTPLHPAWSQIESTMDRYLGLAYLWKAKEAN